MSIADYPTLSLTETLSVCSLYPKALSEGSGFEPYFTIRSMNPKEWKSQPEGGAYSFSHREQQLPLFPMENYEKINKKGLWKSCLCFQASYSNITFVLFVQQIQTELSFYIHHNVKQGLFSKFLPLCFAKHTFPSTTCPRQGMALCSAHSGPSKLSVLSIKLPPRC